MKKESFIDIRLFILITYYVVQAGLLARGVYLVWQDNVGGALAMAAFMLAVMIIKSLWSMNRSLLAGMAGLFRAISILGQQADGVGRQQNNIHKLLLWALDEDEKARIMNLIELHYEDDPEYIAQVRRTLYQAPSEEIRSGMVMNRLFDFENEDQPEQFIEEN